MEPVLFTKIYSGIVFIADRLCARRNSYEAQLKFDVEAEEKGREQAIKEREALRTREKEEFTRQAAERKTKESEELAAELARKEMEKERKQKEDEEEMNKATENVDLDDLFF